MTAQVAVDRAEPAPEVLARAVSLLREGQLLIFPTDTLYALGGCALQPGVAVAVRVAKGREERKPLPLVASDTAQATSLCARWPEEAEAAAQRFWPGPLTLVLPAALSVPREVRGGGTTVAVRVPALALLRTLCGEAGPLIATSANRAGAPPPVTCAEAVSSVGRAAALALDGGRGGSQPSTIVDLAGDRPRLLRAGAVAWDDVLDVIG
jgi:L-threonylcarbamoyladenylate synthase